MQEDNSPQEVNKLMKVRKQGFFFLASGITALISQVYYYDSGASVDRRIWTIAWIGVGIVFVFLGIKLMRKGKY